MKSWQNVRDILNCAVEVYDPGGDVVNQESLDAMGVELILETDGSVTLYTEVEQAMVLTLRLSPNFGAGMGSSPVRIVVTGWDVNAAAPVWDADGAWDVIDGIGTYVEPEVGNWSYVAIPFDTIGRDAGASSFTVAAQAYFDEQVTASYNCECAGEDGIQYRTLAEMRTDMLIGLGRGNQLANPGPGVSAIVDLHLRNAQKRLYQRCSWLLMERYFSWPVLAGVRLYGLAQNGESCEARLNPNKLTSVVYERDGIYIPMRSGIPALMHSYDAITGLPQRYEIRQCIEVWPAPDITAGFLIVKGNFGLLPLVDDDDRASIDDMLICDLALASLKRHFRQPDAEDYVAYEETYLNNLVAGSHGTKRYVPGQRRGDEVVWIEPVPSQPFPDN